MDQSLSAQSQRTNRKVRNLIIVGNALIWLAAIVAIRLMFF